MHTARKPNASETEAILAYGRLDPDDWLVVDSDDKWITLTDRGIEQRAQIKIPRPVGRPDQGTEL